MTGSSCNPLPVDVCADLSGVQVTVPVGFTKIGPNCIANVISEGGDAPLTCINKNLLTNGSFDAVTEIADADAAGGGFYEVFSSITGWASTASFELWNTMFGGASHGMQNAELDVSVSTKITQSISTTVGNVYQVTLAFAPRTGTDASQNKVELTADSAVIGSVSGNGSADTVNNWTTHTYSFTAENPTTVVGLQDKGTSDGVGTLIDNVRVCLVEDNSPAVIDTYEIFGFVWDDSNEDDIKVAAEPILENWTVRAVNASNTEEVITDTTDSSGRYSLNVPAGTWIISQLTEGGWELLSTGDSTNGVGTYTVIVPELVEPTPESLSLLNWLIPTAHAATFTNVAGPFNFGNNEIEERGGGGSSSSGTRVGDRRGGTPTGEVRGASTSTPTGVVLGEATTTMPVGAPNTGAGGTAPISAHLPTLVAILSTTTRKSK